MESLATELQGEILSWCETEALDKIAAVCTLWASLVNESLYEKIAKRRGGDKFTATWREFALLQNVHIALARALQLQQGCNKEEFEDDESDDIETRPLEELWECSAANVDYLCQHLPLSGIKEYLTSTEAESAFPGLINFVRYLIVAIRFAKSKLAVFHILSSFETVATDSEASWFMFQMRNSWIPHWVSWRITARESEEDGLEDAHLPARFIPQTFEGICHTFKDTFADTDQLLIIRLDLTKSIMLAALQNDLPRLEALLVFMFAVAEPFGANTMQLTAFEHELLPYWYRFCQQKLVGASVANVAYLTVGKYLSGCDPEILKASEELSTAFDQILPLLIDLLKNGVREMIQPIEEIIRGYFPKDTKRRDAFIEYFWTNYASPAIAGGADDLLFDNIFDFLIALDVSGMVLIESSYNLAFLDAMFALMAHSDNHAVLATVSRSMATLIQGAEHVLTIPTWEIHWRRILINVAKATCDTTDEDDRSAFYAMISEIILKQGAEVLACLESENELGRLRDTIVNRLQFACETQLWNQSLYGLVGDLATHCPRFFDGVALPVLRHIAKLVEIVATDKLALMPAHSNAMWSVAQLSEHFPEECAEIAHETLEYASQLQYSGGYYTSNYIFMTICLCSVKPDEWRFVIENLFVLENLWEIEIGAEKARVQKLLANAIVSSKEVAQACHDALMGSDSASKRLLLVYFEEIFEAYPEAARAIPK